MQIKISTQKEVLRFRDESHNQTVISRLLGCDQFTVPGFWRGLLKIRSRSTQDDRHLKLLAIENQINSTSPLTAKDNFPMEEPVSRSTTYRRLREMGFRSRVPRTKPPLNSKQKKKRHLFARKHKKWTVDDWKNMPCHMRASS